MESKSESKICYSDGKTEICLGDHVVKKGFFKNRFGRINYVPGNSKPNAEMDFNGLTYVGIDLESGEIIATLVDPKTFLIGKQIYFIKRGLEPIKEIQPDDEFEG